METNKTIIRIGLVSALAFGGFWLAQRPNTVPTEDATPAPGLDVEGSESAEAVPSIQTPDLRFVVGESERFSVNWQSTAESRLIASAGESAVRTLAELEGVLEFTTTAVEGNRVTRRVRFDEVDNSRFLVDGQALIGADELRAAELVGTWTSSGELLSADAVDGSPALAASALESLLATAQTLVPTPDRRRTVVGVARLEPVERPSALQVSQTLVAYDELPVVHADGHQVEGQVDLTLTPDGRVQSLEFSEELSVTVGGVEALSSETALQLTFVDSRDAEVPGEPELAEHVDLSASELEARAGEWTTERVTDFVAGYDGANDDTGAFMWSATARTRLDPNAATALGETAIAPQTPLAGREMALDLLAHSGTPQAQSALVSALRSDVLREEASYPLLLQRLSFVASPTDETIAFAEGAMSADSVDHRGAAAYSVGALAATLAQTNPETSNRLAESLRGALAAADPMDAPGLIGGLGNAGLPQDAPLLNGAATDGSEEVRIAAAMALHKFDDDTSRGTLVALTADSSVSVQRVALQSLNNRTFASEELGLLRMNVESGALAQTNYPMLVTVVADSVGDPAGREVLSQVFERASDDARLRARIRGILR